MTDAHAPETQPEANAPGVTLGVRVCYVVPQADGTELRIEFDDAVDLDPHADLARYRLHRRALVDRDGREFAPAAGDAVVQELDGQRETYRVIDVGDDPTHRERWEVRGTLTGREALPQPATLPGGRVAIDAAGGEAAASAADVLVELPDEGSAAA